jgi:hypothetical protein
VHDKLFQQIYGKAMESSLSTIVTNIYTEHFGKWALNLTQHKPLLCFAMLMTHLWSSLMAESVYRISSATSTVYGLPSSSLLLDITVITPPKFTENLPTLANISTSNLTNHCMKKVV